MSSSSYSSSHDAASGPSGHVPALHLLGSQPAPSAPAAALSMGSAFLHHLPNVDTRLTCDDGGKLIRIFQQRTLAEQLPPPQASNIRTNSKSRLRRDNRAAAVVFALLLICSIAAHAAPPEEASNFLGSWSTAVLSKARANLAATSLPSAGIVIFAGGNIGACFTYLFRCRNAGLCTSSTTERSALCL
jgi:hypothetical protein